MYRQLNIYQANLRKGDGTQHSMMNDSSLQDCSLLLVTEPYVYKDDNGTWMPAPRFHTQWRHVLPPSDEEGSRPRALLWHHRDLRARPIDTGSTDIAGALIEMENRLILALSVYVPQKGSAADPELQVAIECLQKTIRETRRNQTSRVEVVLTGDFNRHDQLWGGTEVGLSDRQGEAEPIIQLMSDLDLQYIGPRGEVTWQSSGRDQRSTIDIILTTPELAEETIRSSIDPTEHGSDHRAIRTEFQVQWLSPETKARKLWKKANWDLARRMVESHLRDNPLPLDPESVDSYCDFILEATLPAIEKYVPIARPSPYTKRWWSEDLTTLRSDYTYWRNKARALRRAGMAGRLENEMANDYRKRFHDAVRNQKKTHWLDFLAESDNIWTAARYMNPASSGFGNIPVLKKNDAEVTSTSGIAAELLTKFFPIPPAVEGTFVEGTQSDTWPMEPLEEDEVRRAIFAASPYKAPGSDGLPAVVWQQLWDPLKQHITKLFQLSLIQGKLLKRWKTATIVPLRKGKDKDATEAGSYRPISLLATLGKAMEAVVAERLSWLAETHNLLPKYHFGARKCRTTTQALAILQECAYEAWRNRKVLSLVSFDVAGAFNGVCIEVLLERLRRRGIPPQLVNWVEDFCNERKASVSLNGETTEERDLPQSGLPQGSCVSPVLFLYFNADLVSAKVNKNGGAMAFVDDYSAWIVGDTAEDNHSKLTAAVERACRWAKASGATFQPRKTSFIHLTRNQRKLSDLPLTVEGHSVPPATKVKILGVLCDQQLRFKLHMIEAGDKGLKAAMALKRIKGLTPDTARKLFTAKVASVMDYASVIWSPSAIPLTKRTLNQAQRYGAQAVTGAYRTLGVARAEAEAGLPPKEDRWNRQMAKFWTKSHTLGRKFWRWRKRVEVKNKRFVSPFQTMAMKFAATPLEDLETIHLYCIPPWQPRLEATILDREDAVEWARSAVGIVFTDASYSKGNIGLGAYIRTRQGATVTDAVTSKAFGHSTQISAYYAELLAIDHAMEIIETIMAHLPSVPAPSVVVSDCTSAITAISQPRCQSGQAVIRSIYERAKRIEDRGGQRIALRWTPAHSKVEGNEKSHEQATAATSIDLQPVNIAAVNTVATTMFNGVPSRAHERWDIDTALPGSHVRLLYDGRPYQEAAMLCRLRSGFNGLNAYLAKIGAADSNRCDCSAQHEETTRHFLFECSRWNEHRELLREVDRSRFGDLSHFLGGKSNQTGPSGGTLNGPEEKWKPDLEVVGATIKFALSTGRFP